MLPYSVYEDKYSFVLLVDAFRVGSLSAWMWMEGGGGLGFGKRAALIVLW